MIRAPISFMEHEEEPELSPKHDQADNSKLTRKHRSTNSLSEADFYHGSEEPSEDNDGIFAIEADNENHADDEIDEPLDFEEQKRRRSFERKVHRQTQRKGSVEDYEQSDDVKFVQRIQSFNSLTGKEIARLQSASPVAAAKLKKTPSVPGQSKAQQLSKNVSPGHQRKNTLDLWKEKAAEMKNTPAFPPHQASAPSFSHAISSKPKKVTKFHGLAEEQEADLEDQSDISDYQSEQGQTAANHHERTPTLQEWKTRAEKAEMHESSSLPDPQANDFGTIEDQSWATNVKCGDTLKRFKQKQARSITSKDFFSGPNASMQEEMIAEESDGTSTNNADAQSDISNYPTSDDGKDPLMRELIRDCLRVVGNMSRSGLINQTQKLALKGLALRKDPRILEIAKRFRQCKSSSECDGGRDLIVHDMELAFARLACNLD